MSFDPVSYAMGKKAGGGGSSVTVEPLTVAENGTYTAEAGKAYSPVTVKIRKGIPINSSTHINPQTGEWERPAGWPDLDSVTLGQDTDIDELYMTYDLSKTEGWGWIGLGATTTGDVDWTVERGHLSGTQFVADETFTVASNGFFRQPLDSTKGSIQLWRMRGYRITKYGFASNASTSAENFVNDLQPCVEVAGRLGFVTNLSSAINTEGTSECVGTVWLERWVVEVDTGAVKDMSNMFLSCYSLQSVDVSGWDTGAVTYMNKMFQNCYSLQSVDAEGIDISRLTSNTPDLNLINLVTLYPFIISTNQNFGTATKLSVDSLIRLVNSLPTVASTRTLTLGKTNSLKLTAEQIAVATEKGWTVA